MASAGSSGSGPPRWEVVGGADKGGILVRGGSALKSQEIGRLGCGALVQEVELKGDRLHFRKLAGDGPWCGWVSVKLKDKDLLLRCDQKQLPDGAGPPYSLIVNGATGYTGGLICEHLDAMLSRPDAVKHRWAVAGRSREKLQALSKRLRTKPDVVVAASEHEVEEMVCQCRVVLSAAGPYLLCGEPVVRACAECGSDYVDITGEVHWVRGMIDKYDEKAKDNGVVLISMCGQDSVPPDVAVNLLVQRLGPLRRVHTYMIQAGAASGGTLLSGMTGMERNFDNFMKAQRDPFYLGGHRKAGEREIDKDCTVAEQCTLFPKLWLGPAGTGLPDSRCVRRSCGLFDDSDDGLRYGDGFALVYRDAASSQHQASEMVKNSGPIPDEATMQKVVAWQQKAARDGQIPRPGTGAPAEVREHYYSTLIAVAETEAEEGKEGKWAYCEHSSPESYEVTAIASVTAALVVCEERSALAAKRRCGLLTPAFALWDTSFVERLSKSPFADWSGRSRMEWQIHDGKPSEEFLKESLGKRTKTMVTVSAKIMQGELKAFTDL